MISKNINKTEGIQNGWSNGFIVNEGVENLKDYNRMPRKSNKFPLFMKMLIFTVLIVAVQCFDNTYTFQKNVNTGNNNIGNYTRIRDGGILKDYEKEKFISSQDEALIKRAIRDRNIKDKGERIEIIKDIVQKYFSDYDITIQERLIQHLENETNNNSSVDYLGSQNCLSLYNKTSTDEGQIVDYIEFDKEMLKYRKPRGKPMSNRNISDSENIQKPVVDTTYEDMEYEDKFMNDYRRSKRKRRPLRYVLKKIKKYHYLIAPVLAGILWAIGGKEVGIPFINHLMRRKFLEVPNGMIVCRHRMLCKSKINV
ncbi:hypothetical protein POCGH01_00140300 [Plasmodium ovale]|uniref:Uncharacterized protein n=1 Tax=Plasmodium ovale TaxID=36330 RepID=A0A1D3JD75_PLAOA|nr:hypothetical protein POCGH01_00140300 [Plasmodium ovale]